MLETQHHHEVCDECLIAAVVAGAIDRCSAAGLDACRANLLALVGDTTPPEVWVDALVRASVTHSDDELAGMVEYLCRELEARGSDYCGPCRQVQPKTKEG